MLKKMHPPLLILGEHPFKPIPKKSQKKYSEKEFFRIIRHIIRLSVMFSKRDGITGIWDIEGTLVQRDRVLRSMRWLWKNLSNNRHLWKHLDNEDWTEPDGTAERNKRLEAGRNKEETVKNPFE